MDDKIFDKFSESARAILMASQQLAESMNSATGSEHVLLALAITRGTFANEILREYDINLDQMQELISKSNEFQTYQIESYPITDKNLLITLLALPLYSSIALGISFNIIFLKLFLK